MIESINIMLVFSLALGNFTLTKYKSCRYNFCYFCYFPVSTISSLFFSNFSPALQPARSAKLTAARFSQLTASTKQSFSATESVSIPLSVACKGSTTRSLRSFLSVQKRITNQSLRFSATFCVSTQSVPVCKLNMSLRSSLSFCLKLSHTLSLPLLASHPNPVCF